jgi:hypothetical protein
MDDIGWGSVNQVVMAEAQRRLRRSRRTPSSLISEATMLGGSPEPSRVAQLLNDAGIDFVIIGAHALAVHTKEPRATADVDIVVDDVDRAVQALRSIRPRTRVSPDN